MQGKSEKQQKRRESSWRRSPQTEPLPPNKTKSFPLLYMSSHHSLLRCGLRKWPPKCPQKGGLGQGERLGEVKTCKMGGGEYPTLTAMLGLLLAAQGLLVAQAIKRHGIVCRLILGTVSICLCVLMEGILFSEPIAFGECLGILLVLAGSSLYYTSDPLVIAPERRHPPAVQLQQLNVLRDDEEQRDTSSPLPCK